MTNDEWNKYIKIFSKGKVGSSSKTTSQGTVGLVVELFKSIFNAIWEIIKVIVQVILTMIGIRAAINLFKDKH